jgi:hypothetical protein
MARRFAARQRKPIDKMKGFIVLDRTLTTDSKIRYIQFGDAHETLEEAKHAARFPGLHHPTIVDLRAVETVEAD